MFHYSKRLIFLVLAAFCLLIWSAACNVKQEEPSPAPQPGPEDALPEPEPQPESPPEPDPDLFVPTGNVNPLTGLCDGISDQALSHRPAAIMVNNISSSLPQWGISQADIIYEMLAEGRITRFLALFQDYEKIDRLASIRSARPYYMDIAQSYGAVYIHFGGSVPAYEAIAARSDLIHIDGIKGNWEGTVFFRDPDRRKQMGLEHSVYTTGEYLQTAMEKLTEQGYDLNQTEHPSAFTFSDHLSENAAAGGQSAQKVTVTFSERHKPWFQYDAQSGKYLRFQYGDPQMDGWLDTQLAVDNVLILRMHTTDIPSDLHLVDIQTTGTGDGYYFCQGKYVPIVWKKDSYNGPISYFDQVGQPLVVSRGTTFVSVVTNTADVIIE